jgi:hypothetical protein
MDAQTAFWTSYKTLAEEYDLEFQRKYGQVLDIALIFVGFICWVRLRNLTIHEPT